MLFLFSIYLVVISSHFPDYFHTHMTLFTFYCQFLHCMKKRCHTITSWHFVFPTFVFRFLSFEAALGQTSCVHYFLLWIYHCQGTKCTFYILTSFVVIPNFLLQSFFKPVLSLFQCFVQSETKQSTSHCSWLFSKAALICFLRASSIARFWAFRSILSLFLFTLSRTLFLGFFKSCSADLGFLWRSARSNFSCNFSSFSSMSSFNLKYSQVEKCFCFSVFFHFLDRTFFFWHRFAFFRSILKSKKNPVFYLNLKCL